MRRSRRTEPYKQPARRIDEPVSQIEIQAILERADGAWHGAGVGAKDGKTILVLHHAPADVAGYAAVSSNILSEEQQVLSGHFAGRAAADLTVTFAETDGVPTLPGNLATLVCTVDRTYDGGDHRVVFGRVDALAGAADDARPLLYYAGGYRQLEQQQRERIEGLDRIGHAIASSLDIDEVFEAFAAQAAQLVRHDAISVALLSEDGASLERFALAAVTGIEPRAGERQRLDETVAGLVMRGGRAIWTNNMAADDRFHGANDRRWIAQGFRHFISVPLRARSRVIGALNILRLASDPFAGADVLVAEQIANQVAIFLDNMRLHARLRRLSVVEERNRIARDIHDTLVGAPTAVLPRLEAAERALHDEARPRADLQDDLQDDLQQAAELARRALVDARRSVWEPQPGEPDGHPFP